MSTKAPKLLDRVRHTLRTQHYAYSTEQQYLHWIKHFILFHHKQHPQTMNSAEIEAFLTHLAIERHVAPSTQNQALAALLFLYQQVLRQDLDHSIDAVRARTPPRRLPTVMSKSEVAQVIAAMREPYQLMAKLMYGSGLRLRECLCLRVQDLDFGQHQLIVRRGKGNKDRDTLLPDSLHAALRRQLRYAQVLHQNDLERGYGRVSLPYALARKYPKADQEWAWQYVFPSHKLSKEPRTGRMGRHHLSPDALQRAVKRAARAARLTKSIGCHTFRQCAASPWDLSSGASVLGEQITKDIFTPQCTNSFTHLWRRYRGLAGRSRFCCSCWGLSGR